MSVITSSTQRIGGISVMFREGTVFTGVCLSTGGGVPHAWPMVPGPFYGPMSLLGSNPCPGAPPPLQRWRLCGAGGMPLAFTQEDFLVSIKFIWNAVVFRRLCTTPHMVTMVTDVISWRACRSTTRPGRQKYTLNSTCFQVAWAATPMGVWGFAFPSCK